MPGKPRLDPRSWFFWLLAATVLALAARNPFYSAILVVVSFLVREPIRAAEKRTSLPVVRIGVTIVLFSALFNGLLAHIGETILLRLPAWPLVGGPITLEAIVVGLGNGLVLVALLSVFTTFNNRVPLAELIRLAPSGLHDLGIVLLVAVTYVPETSRHFRRIREAQAIRGHRMRGWRDWRPVMLPLLIGGLERAMGLAETMVARGYGATTSEKAETGERVLLVLGMLLSLGGWLAALWWGPPGWLLLILGLAVFAWLLRRSSRRTPRSVYRPQLWTRRDTVVAASAVAALLIVMLPWPFVDRSTLAYVPYPKIQPPLFDPLIGLAMSALAVPAFVS